jgi:DNA-binding Lrp family transcriptional regulator
LKELLADGRQTDSEIAKKIGETKESVRRNISKMEKMGIITGATIHINYKIFGCKAVAHILINVDPQQEAQLIEYLQKMPGFYAFYSRRVKGNLDVVTILKTFEELNDVKDAIKRRFQILEMRTALWTDVKETNYNLSITSSDAKDSDAAVNYQVKPPVGSSQNVVINEIDQKIADKLAENGRMPIEELGSAIGTSSDTAKRRYEKLKKKGVLKVTVQINPNKIGYQAMCLFFTVMSTENSIGVIERIGKIPNIISIMKTAGDYDLQIWAMVKDLDQFLAIQDEIGKIRGITKMDLEVLPMDLWQSWPTPRQYISTF